VARKSGIVQKYNSLDGTVVKEYKGYHDDFVSLAATETYVSLLCPCHSHHPD